MPEKLAIKIDEIQLLENVRSSYSDRDIVFLMESIRQDGLLQPVGVVQTQASDYVLLWGYRRLAAMKKLGWKTLTQDVHFVLVDREMSEQDFIITNTIENIQRRDISPIELGSVVYKLIENDKMNFDEVAARLSQPLARIRAAYTTYVATPAEHRKNVGYVHGAGKITGKIPPTTVAYVAKNFDEDVRSSLLDEIKRNHWGLPQLKILKLLLRAKVPFKHALELMFRYKAIDVELLVDSKVAEQLETEHQKTINEVIRWMLTKGIRPRKDLIFNAEEASKQ